MKREFRRLKLGDIFHTDLLNGQYCGAKNWNWEKEPLRIWRGGKIRLWINKMFSRKIFKICGYNAVTTDSKSIANDYLWIEDEQIVDAQTYSDSPGEIRNWGRFT